MKKRFSRLISAFSVALMSLLGMGCEQDIKEDVTPLNLNYVRNTLTITPTEGYAGAFFPAPEYTGKTPSAFGIDKVSKDGQTFESSSAFGIIADNGKLIVLEPETLELGVYKFSISCKSGGESYVFDDILTLEVIKKIDGVITVDPSFMEFDVADVQAIIDGVEGAVPLPVARLTIEDGRTVERIDVIVTDSNGETIAPCFSVEDNVIAPRLMEDFPFGTFSLSLRVKDGSETGLVENALSVRVTSRPRNLVYAETVLEVGQKSPEAGEDELAQVLTNEVIAIDANPEALSFALGTVTAPEGAGLEEGLFSIDEENGTVSVKTTRSTPVGEYRVSVNVSNADVETPVVFNDIFAVLVTKYITPISGFMYPEVTSMNVGATEGETVSPVEGWKGDEVTFALKEETDEVSVDERTGVVTVLRELSGGPHSYVVVASNTQGTVEAEVNINVEDPDYFTYFSYGNNLGIASGTEAAALAGVVSQFRGDTNFTDEVFEVKENDFHKDAKIKWSLVEGKSLNAKASIDEATGKLTVTTECNAAVQIAYVLVKATAGERSISMPVFFNVPVALPGDGETKVTYTPFVLRANPETVVQIKSMKPEFSSGKAYKSDFRSGFNYHNIDGSASLVDGDVSKVENAALRHMWNTCAVPPLAKGGKSGVNYGSKNGMSYDGTKGDVEAHKASMGAYVDQTDFCIVVNSGRWTVKPYNLTIAEVNYTNGETLTFDGVFWCSTVYGETLGGNGDWRAATSFIWLDKDYDPEN